MSKKRYPKRKPDHRPGRSPDGSPIYRTCDEWGEILVIDRRSLRMLTFGSVVEQSCMDVRDPPLLVHDYAKAMMLVMAFIQPETVFVLGVGGGVLVRSVAQLHPHSRIVAVELRPQVLEIAHSWFHIPESPHISLRVSDADAHLRASASGAADLIFSDIFHAHGMSPLQRQEAFLGECHRVLSDSGWLVMNIHGADGTKASILGLLKTLFGTVLLCPVDSGNQIFLASKQPLPGSLSDRFPNVQVLEGQLNVRLDLLFRRLSHVAG